MINNFSKLLGERRLKMTDVSKGTGVALSTLFNLYHDEGKPKIETLQKICDFLQVPLSELIEYDPKKEG